MKRQLLHEQHNRQDKAKKADYQDAFADPFDPGGSYDPTIRLRDIVHGSASKKYFVKLQINIVHFIESTLRGAEHEVDGFSFRFRMTPVEFAKANRLPIKAANLRLKMVSTEASQRLAMTRQSVLRATIESVATQHSSNAAGGLQITFKNFLHQAKPIPWDQIYKKIRLNAVNVA